MYMVLVVMLISLGYAVFAYNQLVNLRETVRNEWKQIDIQLDRRYKVYESLISSVSKYLNYEETVLKDVVALRSQAQSAKEAGDDSNRIASEDAISKIAPSLNVIVESYPGLKGSETVGKLMEEISTTENKLSFAKQSYNDAAERFNAMIQRFPINIVINYLSFEAFTYWQLSSEDAKSKEEYIAKL